MANHQECKQRPGAFVPVIDRNRCEGKGDCERVCPVGVFALGTLPKSMRAGLSVKGRIKGIVHRWQQAILVHPEFCEACSLCVSACPEKAINLARSAAAK
jgi:4Fe-4S ferredoxin